MARLSYTQQTFRAQPRGWEKNPSGSRERALVAGFSVSAVAFAAPSGPILVALVVAASGVLACVGPLKRWKTAPFLGLISGALLAFGAFPLVVREVIHMAVADQWPMAKLAVCFCAVAALGASADEILASLQYLGEQVRHGRSPWRAFLGLPSRPGRRGRPIKTV